MSDRSDPIVRVLAKCDEQPDGCLVFQGWKNPAGYGVVVVEHRRGPKRYTHRLMYERFIGPIPEGLVLDHLCRNRACCNPAHLEAVTRRENNLRGMHPLVVIYREGVCTKGHPMSGDNLWTGGVNGNRRACRACSRERGIARRRQQRAA